MTDKRIRNDKIFSIILITIGVVLSCIGYFMQKSDKQIGFGLMFIGTAGFLLMGLSIFGRAIDEKRIYRFEKTGGDRYEKN